MAGFDNEVMFTPGVRLQPSDAQAISLMQDGTTTNISRVNHVGNPNTVVSANPGSLSHDPTSGFLWLKTSGIGTTVWERIIPGGAVQSVATANSTPQFALVGTTETVDFNLNNLTLGTSLPARTTATANVGMGFDVLKAITSGSNNVAMGLSSSSKINSGTNNVSIGANSLLNATTTVGSVGIGEQALQSVTTGQYNTAAGFSSLYQLITGDQNTALGKTSGGNYTGAESSNIVIGHAGVLGESNKIRIGTDGTGLGLQNATFVAGITGVTVAASEPVAVASTGQLSSLGFGTAGQLLTSTGAGSSPTWQNIFPASFPWIDASGSFNAAVDTGYFLTAASTPTLPLAPAQGTIIEFAALAAATHTITANTGQFIILDGATSAAAGTAVTSTVGSTIRFVYRTVGTTWVAIAANGASWIIT